VGVDLTCGGGVGGRVQLGGGGCGGRGAGVGRLEEGADLVAADGFLLQQGGSQPVEGFSVAGEQVAGRSLRLGQDGGDFLVDEPLRVFGVTS
jgi:hypothetical protein